MEELFQSGSFDQNRSSTNWPLAKILQRYINHVTRRLGLKGIGIQGSQGSYRMVQDVWRNVWVFWISKASVEFLF